MNLTSDHRFTFELQGEQQTAAFGRALADALPDRALVGLNGTLGAGKTRLVQAVAEAVGINRRDVVSPTFVLMQQYAGSRQLYHLDAYRLADADEFWQLGVDEHFDEDVWVFIEWAERIAACLPADRLDIRLEVVGDEGRRLHVVAHGERLAPVVERLRHCWQR